MTGYRPVEYWSSRLHGEFTLRGSGHLSYPTTYNRWRYRAKHQALVRSLDGVPRPMRVLDVGTGTGWGIVSLLGMGATVEGCDLAEEPLELLRPRFPEVTLFPAQVGIDAIPRPDSTYDAVTAIDILYHITSDEQWESAIAELTRVLRPGGRLVVTDAFGPEDVDDAEHVRMRSLDRWLEVTGTYGLELASLFRVHGWLARPKRTGVAWLVPSALRGPLEYGLDQLTEAKTHLRCGVLVKVLPAA